MEPESIIVHKNSSSSNAAILISTVVIIIILLFTSILIVIIVTAYARHHKVKKWKVPRRPRADYCMDNLNESQLPGKLDAAIIETDTTIDATYTSVECKSDCTSTKIKDDIHEDSQLLNNASYSSISKESEENESQDQSCGDLYSKVNKAVYSTIKKKNPSILKSTSLADTQLYATVNKKKKNENENEIEKQSQLNLESLYSKVEKNRPPLVPPMLPSLEEELNIK